MSSGPSETELRDGLGIDANAPATDERETAAMTQQPYAQWLATEGARLDEVATRAEANPDDWQRAIPRCEGWDLEGLIGHCAGVWTFVGSSIAAGGPVERDSIIQPDCSLSQWHADALARITDVLADRDPSEPSWSFHPHDQTIGFWQRRMANEAVMHRWDAQAAYDPTPAPIEPAAAIDGIDELFDFFLPVRQPDVFAGNGQTIHLHATDADGEWVITRTQSGIEVEHAHRKCDVAARGTAQSLLLFVWGRGGTDQLETFGDDSLLADWQREVRI